MIAAHTTFKFYLCNEVGKCEKIYKNDNEQTSYFFFFVNMSDSNSLNDLGNSLDSFKEKFYIDAGAKRFFLILLKTDSQGGGDIKVDAAEKFCKKKELKFFGVIDSQNMTWDFKDKQEYFGVIGEFESEVENNDYKLGKMKWKNYVYEVQEKKDIWVMFLCGVKYSKIREKIDREKFIFKYNCGLKCF